MWRQLIAVLSFILLLHRPAFASTISARLAKKQPGYPFNYRCNRKRLYEHKFLVAQAEEATQQFAAQPITDSALSKFKYPEPYQGTLIFEIKSALMWWPLSKDLQSNSRRFRAGDSFLIFAMDTDLSIVGVIDWKRTLKFEKCTPVQDIPGRLPKASKSGFECLSGRISQDDIKVAINKVHQHKRKKLPGLTTTTKPLAFDRWKHLFGYKGPIFAWPINLDGNYNRNASVKLIINRFSSFVGMVEDTKDGIYLCRPYMDSKQSIPHSSLGHSRK